MHPDKASDIEAKIDWEMKRDHFPEGFPAFPEIPGARYTSEMFYDLEVTHIWQRSWLCVGREDEIPEPGCHQLFERFKRSVIIVRGKDQQIRAFHNTCRHRGAPLVQGAGKRSVLTCRYHSWGYDLEGQLISVSEEQDFGDLDKCSRGLLPVRCELWEGWIFINLDMDAKPLLDELAPVLPDLESMSMRSLSTKGRLKYRINCNWKAAHDAFLEAYHVKSIHPKTVATLLDCKGTAIGLYRGGHSRMAMYKLFNREGGTWGTEADKYDIATVPDIFRRNNVAFGFYPNMVSPVDSGGFPFISFWPDGKDHCEIELLIVGAGDASETCDNAEYWKTFAQNYDAITLEDLQFLEGIQASLDSGAFTGMKLSYQERRIYWLHEEYDRRIGVDRIPPELRVEPLLEPYAEY